MAKSLDIVYLPELDSVNIEEAAALLEESANKHSIRCNNWSDIYSYEPITAFAIAYSDKYIYVGYFVHGNYLRAENYKNNSPVADDSCVEFFMSVPGSKEYWNFEFNCIGTVNASHREVRPNPTRLSDEEIASIKRYASCGTRPFREMAGLFSWNLTVAIPLALVGLDSANMPEKIKGNFYKCAAKTSLPHLLSWSPITYPKPDFHQPEFFGDLYFKK